MTNQLQGEILYGGWTGGAEATWAHSPWIPVRGDVATFGVEILTNSGITLDWEVQTRTIASPSVGTSIASASGAGTVMNSSAAPALELVRYRFKTGTASTTNYVIFRPLQPSWQMDR